jgi:predicted RNase H-like HicB family nuclease
MFAGMVNFACTMASDYHPKHWWSMKIELEQETDGRWIAEIPDLPGVLVYGTTRNEAVAKAEALALRVIADRLDNGERVPELSDLFVVPA